MTRISQRSPPHLNSVEHASRMTIMGPTRTPHPEILTPAESGFLLPSLLCMMRPMTRSAQVKAKLTAKERQSLSLRDAGWTWAELGQLWGCTESAAEAFGMRTADQFADRLVESMRARQPFSESREFSL